MGEDRRRQERDDLTVDPQFLGLIRSFTDEALIDEYAYWLVIYARRYDDQLDRPGVDRQRPAGVESFHVAAEIERRGIAASLWKLLGRPEAVVRGRVAALLLFRDLYNNGADMLPLLRDIAATGGGLAAANAEDDLVEYELRMESHGIRPFSKRVATVTRRPRRP